jgi:hypothetical protein
LFVSKEGEKEFAETFQQDDVGRTTYLERNIDDVASVF